MFEAFAEQREALTRFLRRIVKNAALAEDLTQETWVRATTAQSSITIDNPRSYLFRIAGNLALDYKRHAAHGIELPTTDAAQAVPDSQPSPETIALHRSELAHVLRAMEGLSPRCRQVFVLAKFEGLSYSEIGRRLGITRNTVVSHMVNALSALERAMPRTN